MLLVEALAQAFENRVGIGERSMGQQQAEFLPAQAPDTVARAMRDFAASGVGVMICGFLIDLDNRSRLRRSVRLFNDEVIPAVAA